MSNEWSIESSGILFLPRIGQFSAGRNSGLLEENSPGNFISV